MLSSGRTRAVNKKKPVKSKEKAKMLTTSDQVDKSLGEKMLYVLFTDISNYPIRLFLYTVVKKKVY